GRRRAGTAVARLPAIVVGVAVAALRAGRRRLSGDRARPARLLLSGPARGRFELRGRAPRRRCAGHRRLAGRASVPPRRPRLGRGGGVGVGGTHQERLRTLNIVSVPHPKAFAKALTDSKDQQDRSSYIQLFREEGKAEEVLGGNDFAALRGMLSTA